MGPQHTLYVPGPWLKKGKNEVIVLDIEPTGHHSVTGLPAPILDSLGVDKNRRVAAKREALGTPILDAGDIIATLQMEQKAGPQQFALSRPATLRHICLEITSSYDGENSCLSELTLLGADGQPAKKDAWKVVYVSSEEPIEGDAEQLFDTDANTYWHSRWNGNRLPYPHILIIDLGEIQTISGICLNQRQDVMPGAVKDIKVYGRPQFFLFHAEGQK